MDLRIGDTNEIIDVTVNKVSHFKILRNAFETAEDKKGYRKKKYGIMPPSTALLRAGNRNLGAPALAPVFNK
jgi:hypothetical protein